MVKMRETTRDFSLDHRKSLIKKSEWLQKGKNLSQNYEKNSCILHNIVVHYSCTASQEELQAA